MNKRLPLLLLALSLLWASLSFTGCVQDAEETVSPPTLEGKWESPGGDGFEVSGGKFSYFYGTTVDYAGTIVNSSDLTASSGFITLYITEINEGEYAKDLNAFLVVRWKNLSEAGVQEAGPYKFGSEFNNGMPTQAEAEAEYTTANNYFGIYGDYEKQ
jgi:hypothetical protein